MILSGTIDLLKIAEYTHVKFFGVKQSTSLITLLLTMPSKGVNNALSAGMQSSTVHTLRRRGKQSVSIKIWASVKAPLM